MGGVSTALAGAESLYLVGVAGAVASGLVAVYFRPRWASATARLAAGGWTAALLAAVALFARHRSALGASLSDFVRTPVGDAALVRLLGLAVAYGGVWMVARDGRRFRAGGAVLLAGLGVSVLGHASGGHSAAADNRTLTALLQGVHIASALVWVGGLAAALVVASGPDKAAPDRGLAWSRLSAVAAWSFAVLALSGAARALVSAGDVEAFLLSTYGRIVVVKVELMALLGGIAAVNRFRLMPAGRDLSALARLEAGVLCAVLVLSAYLAHTAPPHESHEGAVGRREVSRDVTRALGGLLDPSGDVAALP